MRAEFLPVTWPAHEAAAAEGSLDASAPLPADGGYIPINHKKVSRLGLAPKCARLIRFAAR